MDAASRPAETSSHLRTAQFQCSCIFLSVVEPALHYTGPGECAISPALLVRQASRCRCCCGHLPACPSRSGSSANASDDRECFGVGRCYVHAGMADETDLAGCGVQFMQQLDTHAFADEVGEAREVAHVDLAAVG